MAIHVRTMSYSFLLLLAAALTSGSDISRSHELDIAINEMIRANYFTFVTLINMSPFDRRIQENVTFLMPNDRILSKSRTFSQNSLSDFLLHHSIPSPLLFDHLQRIPSGSTIPSSDRDFMLDIINNGRKSFFINNVRIISPNLCTASSSIRCHGIDGVLAPRTKQNAVKSCSNATSPGTAAIPPSAASSPEASPASDHDRIISGAPLPMQHVGSRKSSGACMMDQATPVKLLVTFVSISVLGFNVQLF